MFWLELAYDVPVPFRLFCFEPQSICCMEYLGFPGSFYNVLPIHLTRQPAMGLYLRRTDFLFHYDLSDAHISILFPCISSLQ